MSWEREKEGERGREREREGERERERSLSKNRTAGLMVLLDKLESHKVNSFTPICHFCMIAIKSSLKWTDAVFNWTCDWQCSSLGNIQGGVSWCSLISLSVGVSYAVECYMTPTSSHPTSLIYCSLLHRCSTNKKPSAIKRSFWIDVLTLDVQSFNTSNKTSDVFDSIGHRSIGSDSRIIARAGRP